MATTEFSVHKRDIQFVLFEQFDCEGLCKLPAYAEHSKELFDMVLDESIKLATDSLAPLNKIGDEQGAVYKGEGVVAMPEGFKAAYDLYAEGGWIGMVHSPDYGGQGLPHMLKYATGEIFSAANVAFYLTHTLTEGAAHLIERFGTDALRRMYCERMYAGEWAGTMCLTEPSAGSDVGNLKTTARKVGDHYLIQGSKIFITAGEHDLTPNIIHAVLARIEGAPAGTKGISLFAVPKYLVADDGSLGERNDMICGNIEHKMGMKASPTCTLNFGDEGRCKGWLLGEEHQGMRLMFQMMNEERLAVGMQGLSLAAVAYQSALGYSLERTQGAELGVKDAAAPRTRIVNHPDVRRMLMHMKAFVDGLRSMMLATARYIDLSEKAEDEEARRTHMNLVELLTPVCKAYGSDMGFRVNEMAIQVFGGYGYCQEYPVEQYCRDQKISSIYEGTNGIQALDLLGRKIARNQGEWLKQFLGMAFELTAELEGHAELGGLAGKLAQAARAITKTATDLAVGLGKDPAYAMLHACPFLEAFGHVAMAYYLLDAARIAQDKLQALGYEPGAAGAAELLCDNPEAAFYFGRVASARYFIHQILPQVDALARAIDSHDRSALEVFFGE
ncbi:MAG: acyl-CoA dehydrogenase [Deltaproteobacteria bacterium]|nr:acyl-CoA dehydrogenase [Deltaproteobacteria bacterium]